MYLQWRGLGAETKSLGFFANFTIEKKKTVLLWPPLKDTLTVSDNYLAVTNKVNLLVLLLIISSCNNKCDFVSEIHKNGNNKLVIEYPDCNNKNTYKLTKYFENGTIEYEGNIKNNKKNGIFKKWSRQGKLVEKFDMQNDKRNGLTECWYENGVKKSETYFINDSKQGPYQAWNNNSKLILKGEFNANDRNGEWKIYNDNGNWKRDFYKNGILDGYSFEYIVKENDTSYIVGQYKSGKENGLWKWFDNDSILTETLYYEHGVENGEHILFHKNGEIGSKGILVNGKPEGTFNMYDSIGNKTKMMVFENGILVNEKNYR